MHYFKFQHALLLISIFWLCNQGCFCDVDEIIGETNSTIFLNETEDTLSKPLPEESSSEKNDSSDHHVSKSGITLAAWNWEEVGVHITLSLFIIITGLSKVAFHHAKSVSEHVPESCLLIIVGVIVGSIIYAVQPMGGEEILPKFTPELFFLILLPPVILESAYSLYNATFYENLSTILLFAVVGTIFNTFAIGLLLYGLDRMEWMGAWCPEAIEQDPSHAPISLAEILIFSALISAVDPVAVLAIFQEVGVNKDLYFLIFGESLLNDAITVVIYHTMVAIASKPTVSGEDIVLAMISFFTVNLGGIALGVVFGLLTAIITKTTSEVRVVEPLAVLGMAYLSYLMAELFKFSGIISITVCGLLQAHYSFRNISHKSYVTVKYFTKMVSATSEAMIFLFLGSVLLNYHHDFTSGFIYWSLLLCFICRFVGVFSLTALSNVFRVKKIQLQEQVISAYGGLRGAVGFSLVIMLHEEEARAKNVYVTTTLVVILFTVFIQGSTVKPLVKLLNIEISGAKHKTLIGEINDQVAIHLMAGIEEIIGFRWNFYLKRKLMDIDEKYFRNVFLSDRSENRLKQFFEKSSLTYHYAHLYGPVTLVEDHKTAMLHEQPAPNIPREIPFVQDTEPSRTGRGRVSFAGVELRRQEQPELKRGLLKKAFQSNPFQRYFQNYNPDLDNDGTQVIEEQLKSRQQRAKRITQAVYEPIRSTATPRQEPTSDSIESMSSLERSLHSASEHQCTQEERMAVVTILHRAQRRRTVSQNLPNSASNELRTSAQETGSGIEMSPMHNQPSQASRGDREEPSPKKPLLGDWGKKTDN